MSDAAHHSTPNGAGHEHREADTRLIIETIIGLTISVVIVCVIVWGVFVLFQKTSPEPHPSPVALQPQLPPGPHVEEHPAEELKSLHARENDLLNKYGWVDQKAGTVHIPIDKAMDDVVAKLPTRPQQAGGAANAQAR
jgi:hypothetical protein